MNKYTEYLKYKIENSSKVVLVKIGNFYHTFDVDALIVESIFNYKLNINKEIKVGFPISSLEKVKSEFDKLELDYFVIGENKTIKNGNNTYETFKKSTENRYEYIQKYKDILNKLSSYIFDKNSNMKILDKVYEILK